VGVDALQGRDKGRKEAGFLWIGGSRSGVELDAGSWRGRGSLVGGVEA